MKKHGQRMELAGGFGLLLLAMASDANLISMTALTVLWSLCMALLLLGLRFTFPRKRRAAVPARRTSAAPAPARMDPLRPAA